MTDLPLQAAGRDVVTRYKKANDMLESAAIAMRRLKERIEAGESDEDGVVWGWPEYSMIHLEPHMSERWIRQILALAPPGATSDQVAQNVAALNKKKAESNRKSRKKKSDKEIIDDPPKSTVESFPPPDPTYDTLCRAWERASFAARRRFVREYGLRYGAA